MGPLDYRSEVAVETRGSKSMQIHTDVWEG